MEAVLDALSARDFRKAARLAEGALRAAPSFLRPSIHLARAMALLQLGAPGARAQLVQVLEAPGAVQALPSGFSWMLSDCVWGLTEQERAAAAVFNDALVRVAKPTMPQLFSGEHLQYLLAASEFEKADAVLQQYGRYAANCGALADRDRARENLASVVGRSCLALSAEGRGKQTGKNGSVGGDRGVEERENGGRREAPASPASPAAGDPLAGSSATPASPAPPRKLWVNTGARMFRLALKLNLPRLLEALEEGQTAVSLSVEEEGTQKGAGTKRSSGGKELPFKAAVVPQMRDGLLHRQHLAPMLSGLAEFDTALSLICGIEGSPLEPVYETIREESAARGADSANGADGSGGNAGPENTAPSKGKGVAALALAIEKLSPRLHAFVRTERLERETQVRFWVREFLASGEADLLAVAQSLGGEDQGAFLSELEAACVAIWDVQGLEGGAGGNPGEGRQGESSSDDCEKSKIPGNRADQIASAGKSRADDCLRPPLERGAAVSIDTKLAIFFSLSCFPDALSDPSATLSKCYSAAGKDIVGTLAGTNRLRELLALSVQPREAFQCALPLVLAELESRGSSLYALYLRAIDLFLKFPELGEDKGRLLVSGLMPALERELSSDPGQADDVVFERLEALFGTIVTLGCLAARHSELRQAEGVAIIEAAKALSERLSHSPKSLTSVYSFHHLMRPILSSLIAATSAGSDVRVSDPGLSTLGAFDVSHMLFETYAPLLLPALLEGGALVSTEATLSRDSRPEPKPAPPKKGPAAQKALPKAMQAALKRAAKKPSEAASNDLYSLRFPPKYVNFRERIGYLRYEDMGASAIISGVASNFVATLQAIAAAEADAMAQAISPVQYFDALWFQQRLERSAYTRLCVALEGVYMILSGWAFKEFSSGIRDELSSCLAVAGRLPVVREEDLLSNIDSSLFSPIAHLIPAEQRASTIVGRQDAGLFKSLPDRREEIAKPEKFALFTRLLFGDTETMQFCLPADASASARVVELVKFMDLRLRAQTQVQTQEEWLALTRDQLDRVLATRRTSGSEENPAAAPQPWCGISILPSSGLLTDRQLDILLGVLGESEANLDDVVLFGDSAGPEGLARTVFGPLLVAALSVAMVSGGSKSGDSGDQSSELRKRLCRRAADELSGKDNTSVLLASAFRALGAYTPK